MARGGCFFFDSFRRWMGKRQHLIRLIVK